MQRHYFSDIPTQRVAVTLSISGETRVRKREPWVYESSIVKYSKPPNAGDIAIIYDRKKNKLLAVGLIDPDSVIKIRILTVLKPLHLDEAFLTERLQKAFSVREPLLQTDTSGFRWIFGENDYLPGLIIDSYAKHLVIKIYTPSWIPYLNFLVSALLSIDEPVSITLLTASKIVKKCRQMGVENGMTIYGKPTEEVIFKEHGIQFIANLKKGHKTGFFCDHRANRLAVGQLAQGKTVLDVFSYVGAFATHAATGGAKSITCLDTNKYALETIQRHLDLNKLSTPLRLMEGDAFVNLKQLASAHKTFDLVIIDPPNFTSNAKQLDKALQAYSRLIKSGLSLIKKGVLVFASCSSHISEDVFHQHILQELKLSNRTFEILDKTGHDIDHPSHFETLRYLKCVFIEIKK